MELSKRNLARRTDLSNQEAIVKKVLPVSSGLRTLPIAGGRTQLLGLLKPDNIDVLADAVYTWLRGCRYFSEVTISLAADRSKFKLQTEVVERFDTKHPQPVWVTHEDGKRFLARKLAELIQSHKLVAVKANKAGISIQTSPEFVPYRKATEDDVTAWRTANPDSAASCPITVGEPLLSEDWSPQVEFLPSERAEYGHGSV